MHAIHCIRSNLAYKLAFGNRSKKKTCLYHMCFLIIGILLLLSNLALKEFEKMME